VLADSQKLQQVMVNLLDNAAQHSPDGSEIQMIIDRSADGMCRVRITDRGSGIPKENLQRIFEPFFSMRKGGTGLGMSIVKHIVDAHQGMVSIENNAPPLGCTVEIRLPCAGEENP
jgi:signal transduction histidine kinase